MKSDWFCSSSCFRQWAECLSAEVNTPPAAMSTLLCSVMTSLTSHASFSHFLSSLYLACVSSSQSPSHFSLQDSQSFNLLLLSFISLSYSLLILICALFFFVFSLSLPFISVSCYLLLSPSLASSLPSFLRYSSSSFHRLSPHFSSSFLPFFYCSYFILIFSVFIFIFLLLLLLPHFCSSFSYFLFFSLPSQSQFSLPFSFHFLPLISLPSCLFPFFSIPSAVSFSLFSSPSLPPSALLVTICWGGLWPFNNGLISQGSNHTVPSPPPPRGHRWPWWRRSCERLPRLLSFTRGHRR